MVNVGVIGCGVIGKEHISRITNNITGAKVVAVSSGSLKSAKEGAAISGAKVYEYAEDLICDPEVQAIVVASPGEKHAEVVIKCIQAGKRVFCEKPLAPTAAECKRVIAAEMESGKHLVQVGFNRRFDRGYRQMKKILDARTLGEPLIVHCTHRNPVVAPSYTTEMAVYDTLIHEIDILHWLVGDEYESAQVLMGKRTRHALPHLQDPQVMLLRTKGGIIVDVEVFVDCGFAYDINCEVVCEDGTVRLSPPSEPVIRSKACVSKALETHWLSRFIESYDTEFREWIDGYESGHITGPSAWDGYIAAITTDAFVKAQKTGQIEPIELEEKSDFYQ